jgi:hypothetical protein
MHLSPKAIRCIIEALEHYQTSHEERLRDERLTEDEVADLTNDYQYLEAIKIDLKKYHADFSVSLSGGLTTRGNRMRPVKVFEI